MLDIGGNADSDPGLRGAYPDRSRTIGTLLIDREVENGELSSVIAWSAKLMLQRAYELGVKKGLEPAHARLFAWLEVTVGDDTSCGATVDLEGKGTADRMDDLARLLHQQAHRREASGGDVLSAGQVVEEFMAVAALADVVAHQEAQIHAEPQRLGSATVADLIAA